MRPDSAPGHLWDPGKKWLTLILQLQNNNTPNAVEKVKCDAMLSTWWERTILLPSLQHGIEVSHR